MPTPRTSGFIRLFDGSSFNDETWYSAPPACRALYLFLNRCKTGNGEIDFLNWHPDWHRSVDEFIAIADAIERSTGQTS